MWPCTIPWSGAVVKIHIGKSPPGRMGAEALDFFPQSYIKGSMRLREFESIGVSHNLLAEAFPLFHKAIFLHAFVLVRFFWKATRSLSLYGNLWLLGSDKPHKLRENLGPLLALQFTLWSPMPSEVWEQAAFWVLVTCFIFALWSVSMKWVCLRGISALLLHYFVVWKECPFVVWK